MVCQGSGGQHAGGVYVGVLRRAKQPAGMEDLLLRGRVDWFVVSDESVPMLQLGRGMGIKDVIWFGGMH